MNIVKINTSIAPNTTNLVEEVVLIISVKLYTLYFKLFKIEIMRLFFITHIYKFLPFVHTALSTLFIVLVYKYTLMEDVFAEEFRNRYYRQITPEQEEFDLCQVVVPAICIGIIIGVMWLVRKL